MIETCSVVSACSGPLFEGDDPTKNSSELVCCYPGEVNAQFWSWRFNNCALTVFMVSMELVFEQLRLEPNNESLFGRVVKTRCDEPNQNLISV